MTQLSLYAASWLTAATTSTRHELAETLQQSSENRRTIVAGAALGGFLGFTATALAQADAAKKSGDVPGAAAPFVQLINNGTTLLIMIAAALAVLFGVIAGFQFMTAGSNVSQASKAKTTIRNVAIGLIIIGVVYLLKSLLIQVLTGLSSGTQDNGTQENLNLLEGGKIAKP